MTYVPKDAEKLLGVAPDSFVAERKKLAQELRDAGRPEEAAAVAAMRKPSAVVYAVNRAARDRTQAARAAAEAAEQVKKTQLGEEPDAFRKALAELDAALELLAEVALAHVAPRGKAPTEAMRRRVRDLLRAAAADDEARDALTRGALTEELEAVGFSPFAGVAVPAGKRARAKTSTRADQQEARRRGREQELRAELADAEQHLKEAERAVREAERERTAAGRAVQTLRRKLERLD